MTHKQANFFPNNLEVTETYRNFAPPVSKKRRQSERERQFKQEYQFY